MHILFIAALCVGAMLAGALAGLVVMFVATVIHRFTPGMTTDNVEGTAYIHRYTVTAQIQFEVYGEDGSMAEASDEASRVLSLVRGSTGPTSILVTDLHVHRETD